MPPPNPALAHTKATGSIETYWGSFGTWGENANLAVGTSKFGEFIALDGVRTGHFLDTPEFLPIHDIGNSENIFDRMDYQPTGRDAFHLNLYVARNWFQVPNDFDQLSQDQKQRVLTWNVAPGYQHTFGSQSLLTINPFVRRDQVNYYGSRNPLADNPAAISQNRFLTNYGVKADYAIVTRTPQPEIRHPDSADPAAGKLFAGHHESGPESRMPRSRRRRGGAAERDQSRRMRPGRSRRITPIRICCRASFPTT